MQRLLVVFVVLALAYGEVAKELKTDAPIVEASTVKAADEKEIVIEKSEESIKEKEKPHGNFVTEFYKGVVTGINSVVDKVKSIFSSDEANMSKVTKHPKDLSTTSATTVETSSAAATAAAATAATTVKEVKKP